MLLLFPLSVASSCHIVSMAARAVAAPSPTPFEGVINLSCDAKIHRHILDVLTPVSCVRSKSLHLREGDETRDDGKEMVDTRHDKVAIREEVPQLWSS